MYIQITMVTYCMFIYRYIIYSNNCEIKVTV